MVLESPYKGGTKTWSNRWHFNSQVDMTEALFEALANWLKAYYKGSCPTETTVKEAIGYNGGSDVPVWSLTINEACLQTVGSNEYIAPLETVMLWRFDTAARSTKNHPIYLFKYMHSRILHTSEGHEEIPSGRLSTYNTYVDDIANGTTIGGTLYKICGPRGAAATGGVCERYCTHRDFPA